MHIEARTPILRRSAVARRSGAPALARRILTILVLASCGGPENADDPGLVSQQAVAAPSPLHLRLEVPGQVDAQQPVPMRLVLENRGDDPIEVELQGSPIAFDLVAFAADGSEVWRRLEGVAVDLILQPRTLGPGESLEFTDTWTQRDNRGRQVSPGTYRVQGILPVVDVPDGWGTELHTLTIH